MRLLMKNTIWKSYGTQAENWTYEYKYRRGDKTLFSHIEDCSEMNVSAYKFCQLVICTLTLKNVRDSRHYLVDQMTEIHFGFYQNTGHLIILSGKKTQLVICIGSIICLGKF